MKVGDLIYHVDDWADKKPVVGVVVGLEFSAGTGSARVLFTDKVEAECWPQKELRHVEHDESR
jgi:hypothetical protein